MSDGRIRSGRKPGQKIKNLSDNPVLNIKYGDNVFCDHCGKAIKILMINGRRNRNNRIDCEDNHKLVSFHLVCYDILTLGLIRSETLIRTWKLEN